MSFTLQTFDERDIDRLIEDAAPCLELKEELTFLWRSGRLPTKWVVDDARRSYMIAKPSLVPRETSASIFLFRFEGSLREIRVANPFSFDVCFVEMPSPDQLPQVKQLLIDAFAVFGRSGTSAAEPFVPHFVGAC